MGERKGQNHYYPPDYDPKFGSLNSFLGTHALRERAKKIHLGIIIIRFEMPYNIWCDGCKNHIGMGVRYNAEKTKVGMYYSTPVYQFKMKCHLCDNYFEIKTDPKNLDYEIISGARRQENRWDPTQNSQIVPETKEVQKKLFDDAMYKLEHQAKDLERASNEKPVISSLYQKNDVWRDCYDANSKLRAIFREQKKEIKLTNDKNNELKSRACLNIDLLPEQESDRQLATMLKLQTTRSIEETSARKIDQVLNKPMFSDIVTASRKRKIPEIVKPTISGLGIMKKEKLEETKSSAQQELTKKPQLICDYSSSSSDND